MIMMKKMYSIVLLFLCATTNFIKAAEAAPLTTDIAVQTEPHEETGTFEQLAEVIKALANHTDLQKNSEQFDLTIFKVIDQEIETGNFVSYTINKDDQTDQITLTLHQDPKAITTNKIVTLDEEQSEIFETALHAFKHKRSKKISQKKPKTTEDLKQPVDDDAPRTPRSKTGDDNDHQSDGYAYDPSQITNFESKVTTPTSKELSPLSKAPQKQPVTHRPSYGNRFHQPVPAGNHMGYNPFRPPSSPGGAIKSKIAFGVEKPIKAQNYATVEDIKSIHSKGTTAIGGSQTRVREPEEKMSKRIYPSPQHLDHVRKTKRISHLKIHTEKKINKPVTNNEQQEPIKISSKPLLQRAYMTVTNWLSSVWKAVTRIFR